MRGFWITLGGNHPEVLCTHLKGCHSTYGEYVVPDLLEAQGAYTVHTRCPGQNDQKELEGSRKCFWEGPGWDSLAPPNNGVQTSLLDSWSNFRRGCPVASCSVCYTNDCAEEKLWPFPGQRDPPSFTGVAKDQKYLWPQPMTAGGWNLCTWNSVHTGENSQGEHLKRQQLRTTEAQDAVHDDFPAEHKGLQQGAVGQQHGRQEGQFHTNIKWHLSMAEDSSRSNKESHSFNSEAQERYNQIRY